MATRASVSSSAGVENERVVFIGGYRFWANLSVSSARRWERKRRPKMVAPQFELPRIIPAWLNSEVLQTSEVLGQRATKSLNSLCRMNVTKHSRRRWRKL